MDEGARRWLAKAVRKNYWRVSAWYELEDLLQEGYEVYYYVVRHYPRAKDRPHLMALFKLAFTSRINDLATRRTRRVEEVCESDLASADEPAAFLVSVPAAADITEAAAALACAPQYVKDALALFGSEDGLRRLRHKARRSGPGRHRRETLNERLCRLTGHDPAETDIVGAIRACLT